MGPLPGQGHQGLAGREQKVDLLTALGKEAKEDDKAKLDRYAEEQKDIKEKADEEEQSSEEHMAPPRHPGARR